MALLACGAFYRPEAWPADVFLSIHWVIVWSLLNPGQQDSQSRLSYAALGVEKRTVVLPRKRYPVEDTKNIPCTHDVHWLLDSVQDRSSIIQLVRLDQLFNHGRSRQRLKGHTDFLSHRL